MVYGKTFRRNLGLFLSWSLAVCVAVTGLYFFVEVRRQTEKVETAQENSVSRISAEIDRKLLSIYELVGDIAEIAWVRKFSSPSEVFSADFTVPRRLEYQQELSRYFSVDSSITDIAVYSADREMVLCQKGQFTREEYANYLRSRCDIDPDVIFSAAAKRNGAANFLSLDFNLESSRNDVVIQSVVDVSSPSASVIIILNQLAFESAIRNMMDENVLGMEVQNLDGETLFRLSDEMEGAMAGKPSEVLPAQYVFDCPELSSVMGYGSIILTSVGILLILSAIMLVLSFWLSLYSSRPLWKLVGTIGLLTADEQLYSEEVLEFEAIENLFVRFYTQNQDLEGIIRENYRICRQYALVMSLSEGKFEVWRNHLEMLDISFTDRQSYSTWIIGQQETSPEQVDYPSLLSELDDSFSAVEAVFFDPTQTVLILGVEESLADCSVLARELEKLTAERYGVVIECRTGEWQQGIAGIARSYRGLTGGQKTKEASGTQTKKELVQYIDENYCDPDISLKALSDRYSLSVPTVSRFCKESLGISFIDYLTMLRIRKAKQLLVEGVSIAKIAEAVGYGSEYSFRRAFQRSENCRPQDWRAEHIDKEKNDA